MKLVYRLILPLMFLVGAWPAVAMDAKELPDVLKPWVSWALMDQPDYRCPFLYRDFQQKYCSGSGPLTLALEARQGRFSGVWTLYRADWVHLPGDEQHWPQQVTIEQKPAVVVEQQGRPVIWMPAGRYAIEGRFFWDKLPDRLAVSEDSGLIQLSVNGQSLAYPRIEQGALWLLAQPAPSSELEQNSLDLQVFRQVIDDNPLQVLTRLELNVSGVTREMTLPHALLPGFIPIKLDSPLPARIEPDGRLLLQVRAGHWMIDVHARHSQALTQLELPIEDPDWPESELWAFQAMPALRLVEIEELPAVDASQTNMPAEWRQLPAYQIQQGQRMVFKLIRRGDPEPEPNQLSLQRKLWLDFKGGGYTVSDHIQGKMTRDWRLNALPELTLGQVLLNQQNQLITQLPDQQQGVEVRRGAIELQADSRIQADIGALSAVGWRQSFHRVSAELNIPPGWRLLAVSGVDNEPDSWLTRWTLLDLFLVLIIALAVTRLWCWQWGGLALFSLLLFWHEADAPHWIWLHTLAALALLRVLPDNRFAHWVKWYRNVCWLGLVLIGVPFMIAQVRIGLYPQLEKPWQPIMPVPYADRGLADEQAMPMQAMEMAQSIAPAPATLARKSKGYGSLGGYADSAVNFDRIDPEANLQTGPGLPQWQWQTVHLSWNGAVDSQQSVRFWYLSPAWTLWLHLFQAVLVALMSLQMLGVLDSAGRWIRPQLSVWLLLMLLSVPPADSFADIPDPALLEQLKTRLLEAPQCLPACAQIPAMSVEIKPDSMRLNLQIHAQQDVAVPLPAQLQQWYPEQIQVDGHNAEMLIRQNDGSLWMGLTPGVHTVWMQGRLANQQKFTLPLALTPQRVEATADGWRVDGVYENGRVGPQLEFSRLQVDANAAAKTLQQAALPAFIRIERTLHLGLDWRMTTRVVQLAGADAPVVLEWPLLPGEAVTSAEVRVKNGKVLVNMAAGQDSLEWQSLLDKSQALELKTADTAQWSELWRADVSPIWHLEATGIVVVHHQDPQGAWLPEWRPWPGETLRLEITRPQPVPGATLTIDKAQLTLQPGKRSQRVDLILNLRSSKGGLHTLNLPEQAVLQTVNIDGIAQPIRQKGRAVTLPIRPGAQQVSLNWQVSAALPAFLASPEVDLGIDSVNSHIQVNMAEDRWVLFTLGPSFGPAALIWGLLLVLLALAWGLGRIPVTPLKAWQWFLLLVGLSQLHIAAAMVVVAWLFALGLRGKTQLDDPWRFNALQLGLGGLTLVAMLLLFAAVQQGLLGMPDMQIAGNQSTAMNLNWYQDRTGAVLPVATVISAPMRVYRLLMLCWSLWMAISLLAWLRWGWSCFARGELWKAKPVVVKLGKP